jgi:HK97 family phage prohead protease
LTRPHQRKHKRITLMETTKTNIERRALLGTVELRMADGQEWPQYVEGVAAVVNSTTDIGWFEERIAPGAFDEALKTSDIRVLGNHDPNIMLGRTASNTAEVWVDTNGNLAYKFQPDENNPTHVSWVRSIQRGDISQSSFAFTVDSAQWSSSQKYGDLGLRTIVKVRELYDVSPVTYPAYADTSISARDEQSLKAERAKIEAEQNERREKVAGAKKEALKTLIKTIQ